MSNPTEGPFAPAAHTPEYGDPEILPKGVVVRPSAERMPFGPSGELLPEGPLLPADFLLAPDLVGLPWTRKRGDEWTDPVFRQIVFEWLIDYFDARSWPIGWTVREWASRERMAHRLPDDEHYLVVNVVRRADRASFEGVAIFPVALRGAVPARVILDRLAADLDALAARS